MSENELEIHIEEIWNAINFLWENSDVEAVQLANSPEPTDYRVEVKTLSDNKKLIRKEVHPFMTDNDDNIIEQKHTIEYKYGNIEIRRTETEREGKKTIKYTIEFTKPL